MDEADEIRIHVIENGPYLVTGRIPMREQTIGQDEEGASWTWEPGEQHPLRNEMQLCRCGHSSSKPFCDGTHAKIGFEGTETADRIRTFDERADWLEGPAMILQDDQPLCAFARFCDARGTIWNRTLTTDEPESRDVVEHEGTHCPSGRLVVTESESEQHLEPQFTPSLGLIEDPAEGVSGPIWVRGGVRVVSSDGHEYEVRNRQTLCRCGASSNKPFCDGTHASIGFQALDDDD